MKRRPILVLSACLSGLPVTACQREEAPAKSQEAAAPVTEISIGEAAALHETGGAVFVDANAEGFRAENGIVPGAVLLASSSASLASMLPADKDTRLVFYCSSRL